MRRISTLAFIILLGVSLACSLPLETPAEPTSIPLLPTTVPPQATNTPLPGSVPVTGEGIDLFVGSLPHWSDVSPTQTENNGVPTGDAAAASEEIANDTLFTCTTTPYSITKNPQEIAIHNPDAAVLWPGALIRGDSHLQIGSLELLAVSRERRAPLGISIQGGGVLGIPGGVSTVVEQPVGSTIREGINQIVVNTLGADVAVGAGASSFLSVESHSST